MRFKCYGLRFEWLKLKLNSGFYPREGRYAVIIMIIKMILIIITIIIMITMIVIVIMIIMIMIII